VKNQYRAAPFSPFSNEEAQEIGEHLEKIRGALTPARIVDTARPESSPIHRHFEWNDTEAAEAYRREQAGSLIRHIYLVPVENDEIPTTDKGTIRAFHSVDKGTRSKPKPQYVHVLKLRKSPDLLAQVVASALQELRAWQQRYQQYKALEAVVNGHVKSAVISLEKIQDTTIEMAERVAA